tara:strand:+ start:268 stop:771 length:504 start_codon:yes stop_codon:yes gene_type:complete
MVSLIIKTIVVYFLFIAVFGNSKDKPHAVIVFLSCLVLVLFPLTPSVDTFSYIENKGVYTCLDGVTALILTMFMNVDKTAWKQAALLSFATLCHIMVILSLINQQAGFFYNWYSELIFLIGILQIMVSYDGFIHALSNLQALLLRAYTYCNRTIQNLPLYKNSGKRT